MFKGEGKMNIYQKIAKVRVDLQNLNIKKSGFNKFANFDYFTLEDILPTINKLMKDNGLLSMFSMGTINSSLVIVNVDDPNEMVTFECPNADADIKGCTPVQCLGGEITYLKRYLYLNAFEIVEGDVLDALVGTDKLVTDKKQDKLANKVVTSKDIQKADYDVVKLSDKLEEEMDIDKALQIKTAKGTLLKDLDKDQLQFIVENSKDKVRVKAAQIILDNWDFFGDTYTEEDMKDLPF